MTEMHLNHGNRDHRSFVNKDQLESVIWSFDKRIVRLETLDSYAVPSDDALYSAFLRGEAIPQSPPDSWKAWFEKTRLHTSSGKEMIRIHIVPEELTPYLRYEIEWAYLHFNQPNGEKVYMITRDKTAQGIIGAPQSNEDYYLIDDTRVLFVNYDSQNQWTGLELLEGRRQVDRYTEHISKLLDIGVPLNDYMKRLREATLRVRF